MVGCVPAAGQSLHQHGLGSMNSSAEHEHFLEIGGRSGSACRDQPSFCSGTSHPAQD